MQCDDAQNFLAAFVRADKSKKIDPALQLRVKASDRLKVVKLAPTQAPLPVEPPQAALVEEVKA